MTNSIYEVVPKRKTSIIRNTKIILNLPIDHIVTYNDVDIMKEIISNHIHIDNLSPSEIAKKYNIDTNSYHIFISKTLGIKLKSSKEGVINYFSKNNLSLTDDKKLYWKKCKFTFLINSEPNILGSELIRNGVFSTPQNKINYGEKQTYLHRDHMVSISYGYENNIPPEHISHPANCEILTEKDNISKSSTCSITYEHLLYRINNWNNNSILLPIQKSYNRKILSSDHKKNISNALLKISSKKGL